MWLELAQLLGFYLLPFQALSRYFYTTGIPRVLISVKRSEMWYDYQAKMWSGRVNKVSA